MFLVSQAVVHDQPQDFCASPWLDFLVLDPERQVTFPRGGAHEVDDRRLVGLERRAAAPLPIQGIVND